MANNISYLIQVTAPASETVTLSEAKLYLRVDGTDEDAVITRLITSARQGAENYIRRSLITQTWKMAYDAYAPESVEFLRGPVQSVTSVNIVARDTTITVVDSANYYLSADKAALNFDVSVMGHLIEITYVAGFGAASDVPDSIKQGMLMHIAQMYDNRDQVFVGENSRSLYDSYRSVSL